MAINDKFMLPKRVRTMEQMGDLLAAEQAELDQTQRTIAALENQLTISTSTHLLPRHERLFSLSVNTMEKLEVRRARVLAKLNARGTTTVRKIRDLVEIFGGQAGNVVEHFGEYAFSVVAKTSSSNAIVDAHGLVQAIEAIKPAHLVFEMLGVVEPEIGTILHMGGFMASITRLPVPEAADSLRFISKLQIGGTMSSITSLPVPEVADSIHFSSRLCVGGQAAAQATIPIPER